MAIQGEPGDMAFCASEIDTKAAAVTDAWRRTTKVARSNVVYKFTNPPDANLPYGVRLMGAEGTERIPFTKTLDDHFGTPEAAEQAAIEAMAGDSTVKWDKLVSLPVRKPSAAATATPTATSPVAYSLTATPVPRTVASPAFTLPRATATPALAAHTPAVPAHAPALAAPKTKEQHDTQLQRQQPSALATRAAPAAAPTPASTPLASAAATSAFTGPTPATTVLNTKQPFTLAVRAAPAIAPTPAATPLGPPAATPATAAHTAAAKGNKPLLGLAIPSAAPALCRGKRLRSPTDGPPPVSRDSDPPALCMRGLPLGHTGFGMGNRWSEDNSAWGVTEEDGDEYGTNEGEQTQEGDEDGAERGEGEEEDEGEEGEEEEEGVDVNGGWQPGEEEVSVEYVNSPLVSGDEAEAVEPRLLTDAASARPKGKTVQYQAVVPRALYPPGDSESCGSVSIQQGEDLGGHQGEDEQGGDQGGVPHQG